MSVPPGWYRDPAEPTVQRWWDGEGWVGDPLPADATPPPGPPAQEPPVPVPVPMVPAVPGVPGATEPAASPPGAVEPVPPGWSTGRAVPDLTPPRPQGYPLATLGSRLVARLVDIGIVLALNVVVNGWFVYQFWLEVSPVVQEAWRRSLAGETMSDLPETGDAGNLQLVILVLATALWFAYEVPAIANTGQTPGKRLLRIRVVRLEATEPLGFGRSFRRWNTMGLPTLLWWCFGIGFLLQLVDALFAVFDRPLQQALHDKSAHTAVISVAAPPRPAKESPDEQ
ncbi:MAG: DUF2510 domain-containing protein [Micromonosporaceae bacterium]|nr:DUF2510 domain-containing protein [Micromonosporaceae bacterium]